MFQRVPARPRCNATQRRRIGVQLSALQPPGASPYPPCRGDVHSSLVGRGRTDGKGTPNRQTWEGLCEWWFHEGGQWGGAHEIISWPLVSRRMCARSHSADGRGERREEGRRSTDGWGHMADAHGLPGAYAILGTVDALQQQHRVAMDSSTAAHRGREHGPETRWGSPSSTANGAL